LSANLLNMIGIGPFITIPLMLAAMGGPQALLGWGLGAILCVFDGLVWAELGSAMPHSGGTYHYLRETFGAAKFGRLFGFVFLWQSLLLGPLAIASGAVGSAAYATYLFPQLHAGQLTALAAVVCLVNTALLYRDVGSIERLSITIGALVIASLGWILLSGAMHFNAKLAFDFPPGAFKLTHGFWVGLGAATLIGVYDYGGYNNVCMIGGEIKTPRRTIPAAVLISIAVVAALYVGLNLSILGVVPWRVAVQSKTIAADFMQTLHGRVGGVAVAVMILIAGWGGAVACLLGYSRIPYAAAACGDFFKVFARLHPKGRFPTVSLVFIGVASAVACFVSLQALIDATIVIQAMFQFLLQCLAVVILRQRKTKGPATFRMPLYPLPLIITAAGWLYIIYTCPLPQIGIGVGVFVTGAAVFMVRARLRGTWPFKPA
jgi:amino acid transporter